MKKINVKGEYQKRVPIYDEKISREERNSIDWKDWQVSDVKNFPTKDKPNMMCDCGCEKFHVCWIDYPDTGGFCRIICSNCDESIILINDFA